MANYRALTINSGNYHQLADVDSLVVGAGITTSGGSLTITGGADSTWSLSSGTLTVGGAAGFNLQANGSTGLKLLTNSHIQVQAGWILDATGSGNINLPNNGSARFQVEGSTVSANVTATNLGTLTGGATTSAAALHTHPTALLARIAKTVSYNLAATDCIIGANTTGGAITLTLPLANSVGDTTHALAYIIVDEGGAALVNNITVATSGGNTISGGLTSLLINTNGGILRLYSNGVSKWIVW